MNSKGADQSARMWRLVCACVIHKPEDRFSRVEAQLIVFYLQKDKQLRQEVLKKIHELVKQDHLPWDNRDLSRSVSKVLRIVVDSYDE